MAISLNTDCDVVVIGAGCAGLAAAARLSRHVRVVVIEEAPRLGGRATTFEDRESGQRLDNGQHALFGCYSETYDFLRGIATANLAPLDPALRLTMVDTKGRASTLSCPAWPPPLHLAAGVLSWRAVPMTDRLAALRLAGFLWRVRNEGAVSAAAAVPAHLTVTQWLRDQGQPSSLCDWLWHPLALAAMNQSPDVAAARPFVRALGELFGSSPAASSLGVPSVPLDELYAEPAARMVEERGGQVLRRTRAHVELDVSGRRHQVFVGDRVLTPKAIISAVPWHAFGRLWRGAIPKPLSAIAESASRMASVPIVTVNLWFDRPAMVERQVGLVGTEFHWAFRKANNLVSLVASGANHLLRRTNDDLAAEAERELRACLVGAVGAVCLRSLVVREARATFSLAPDAPARPATQTPVPGFFLAGDWTDTGLPGTIEGGVLSGHRAADAAMIVL
ncbi:MAG: FAD-dependent oxidoreductase [Acidobacteria bacterium]|nr:FAD-dependent oxidoreductase [Acidobacteriota bacterium]